jgi:hypothetical protein
LCMSFQDNCILHSSIWIAQAICKGWHVSQTLENTCMTRPENSLTSPFFFIEGHGPRRTSDWLCVCVLGVLMAICFYNISPLFPQCHIFCFAFRLLIASPWNLWLWFIFMFSVHIHRKVWRYQRGSPGSFLIEEGQTTQWPKVKKKTDKGANNVHVHL